MSNRYLVFLLVTIVIISIAINYVQYENAQYLEKSISEYQKQIDSAKLTKVTPPIPVPNPVNQSSAKVTPVYNTNDTNLQSISAVAVSPVLQSDGFFET